MKVAKAKETLPPAGSAILLAVNSRYEDARGKRVHIHADIPEVTLVTSRGKPSALLASSPEAVTIEHLDAYGCQLGLPLWLRPPFVLPMSLAPWSLEAGRAYHLAAGGVLSTPVPAKAHTSKQARLDWELENLLAHPRLEFLPFAPSFPRKANAITGADQDEINVRLWNDRRGPGHPARQLELQAEVLRLVLNGGSLDRMQHLLPTNRAELQGVVSADTVSNDGDLNWTGKEEAVWAALMDDPDIDRFVLDTEESEQWTTTKNLFLESDNLLALKLLSRGYDSKVKCTYIDPPYNTGNAFVYNDKFTSAANQGSPYTGRRWGAFGTWPILKAMPWINEAHLAQRNEHRDPTSIIGPLTQELMGPWPTAQRVRIP